MKSSLLVKKAMKGDAEAFITIIKNYEAVLHKTAYGFFKDPHDVADVLQNTTLIAYESINKLRDPTKFNTWVYRILINESQRMIKEEEKHTSVTYDESQQTTEQQDTMINNIVFKMDERYQYPLVLYYYSGFSIKEISQLLNKPEGTIKSDLFRGKKILRKAYDQ